MLDFNGDGCIDSNDLIICNAPPTADAGLDQSVHPGDLVTLDGFGSSDVEGDQLTYSWAFTSVPSGSTATLDDPTLFNPTFTADVQGTYVLSLVVDDGIIEDCTPDTVTISTVNVAPVANAGPDQSVTLIGTMVQLDGTQSYDADGDTFTHQWTLLSKPPGSTTFLVGDTTELPTFLADVYGVYKVQLVVSDPWTQGFDTVEVSFNNLAPVADAGSSQSVVVFDIVTLDGNGSTDANGDSLTYKWDLISAPVGSLSVIADPTSMIASFSPDLPGAYVMQLVVNDGYVASDPDTIQVQAVALLTAAIEAVQCTQEVIASLNPDVFINATMLNTLLNMLNAVIANIERGNYAGALEQLQNDILAMTNGCANTGAPDRNDWVRDCTSQGLISPCLLDAIARLQALL